MTSVFVRHPLTVRVRVTPDFKKRMAAEIQESMKRLDIEIGQLDFQQKRFSFDQDKHKEMPPQSQSLKQQLEAEKQKRLEQRSELLGRLKEVAKLQDGTEIVQGTAEAMSPISVGSQWDMLTRIEVVIEDTRVVEIRGVSRGS